MYWLLSGLCLAVSCSKDEENQTRLDPPVVYSVSPLEGRPGSVVTIEGENFSRLRVDNKVLFNGVEANIIHFNQNTIHVNAPEESSDGPVTVTVAGQAVDGPEFRFIQPPAPTGETVIVKVLSIGAQPWSAANAWRTQEYLEYYGELAKSLDVDFMVAREMDSVTTRSAGVDRPKVLSELSGLEHYLFSRAILTPYQGGYFGISVYSKHPIVEQHSVSLNNNRTLGLLKVQLTDKSQIAFGGVQMEDVNNAGAQGLRNGQANLLVSVTNDIMIPTIVAGGIFMMNQQPEEDPTFQIFRQAGYVPGCSSCEWTSILGSPPIDIIADFIMFKWARDARVLKYEVLEAAPGANRRPAYAEIELSL